jgi:hypothetical protein
MANVHTAEQFGLDVPGDAYERMAEALRDDDWESIEGQDWYKSAQTMAEDQRFFHWELEFPIAFYEQDGERKEDGGFDAVIGNPPYVRMEQIKPLKTFLSSRYFVHDERVDLYGYFIERSIELTSRKYGVIVSNKWMKSEYGENIRSLLSENHVEKILDFGDLEVFSGISTYPCILVTDVSDNPDNDVLVVKFNNLGFSDITSVVEDRGYTLSGAEFDGSKWKLGTPEEELLATAIQDAATPLLQHQLTAGSGLEDELGRGIVTGGNEAFIIDDSTKERLIESDSKSSDIIHPILKGTDISRYYIEDCERYLIYSYQGINIEKYPEVKSYLSQFKDKIGDTATDEEWYELQQPQREYENYFENPKICYPDIAKECSFAMDTEGQYLANTCYFVPSDSYALLAVLNSTPMNWYYQYVTSEYRGGYQRSFTHAIKELPIPDALINSNNADELSQYAEQATNIRQERNALNLNLLDYLGIPSDGLPDPKAGDTLGEMQMPVAGVADTPLSETTDEYDGLRIEGVSFAEDGGRVVLSADISYKVAEDDPRETDRWDRLAESEFETYEAMAFVGLSDAEETLLREFVPVAVEEAGGFAGFRQSATKTNSPLDRLKALTLPDIDAVQTGLEQYIDVRERADELEEKIDKTDQLIDEIVYDLYGLTDEEIEIVEDAVGE